MFSQKNIYVNTYLDNQQISQYSITIHYEVKSVSQLQLRTRHIYASVITISLIH